MIIVAWVLFVSLVLAAVLVHDLPKRRRPHELSATDSVRPVHEQREMTDARGH